MLSGLLDVRTAAAKQAVITAIDLLGMMYIYKSSHSKNKRRVLSFSVITEFSLCAI